MQKDGEMLTHIRFGAHGERVLAGMRRAIAAFALAGNNVIVDDLLFKPEYLDDYALALEAVPTWLIGVRCSLEVVNERETGRTGRFPGTATSHFHEVHSHEVGYDLEIDTSDCSPKECALRIISRLDRAPEVLEKRRRLLLQPRATSSRN